MSDTVRPGGALDPAEGEETASPSRPGRAVRVVKRVALTLLTIAFALVALAFLLYGYGSMEPPSREMRARYAALEAAGLAPRAPAGRFHVPIPGCRCHSDDPVMQIQHENLRMRECSGCHSRGPAARAGS